MNKTRNTIQRTLVLKAVQNMHNHPTAEEIYAHVARRHPSVSRGTVYRNLNVLAQQGQIRRVSHLNAADRFDFQLEPHHHFRCRACGGVFDVQLPGDGELLANASADGNFLFEGFDLVFNGLCPHCQQNRGAS